eukprot:TRINITY_DN15039_c0_g1_i1.p1 TRINITY_DN15039_c0_g1~~TRINITY_DN15039_c0_g1_i1.p1  ORF type:complete len:1225 (+),score=199.44 TRINITY_DN15039_c0_g1_i1:419-3676(+)
MPKEELAIIFRPFKNPSGEQLGGLKGKTLGTRKRAFEATDVRFLPKVFKEDSPKALDLDSAANRLVLFTPPPDDPERRREVIVDAELTRVIREHQRIGVQFLFDCLMGLKDFDGCGCILADDMGLGKTLQSVCIMWTLLTQGGPNGTAACRKALVVCPASLVKNWAAEFDKWLHGKCKYVAVAATGQAQVSGTFGAFKHNRDAKVLISSYETFRGHASEVADCGIDLVCCDEAHKLKNDDAAVTRCIVGLSAKRRLLISGTPIQNNLDEFFTLVSVANPGVFGDSNEFRRNYGAPILRGREPTATEEERRAGTERLAAVSQVTEQFILRRTNRLNARFLPPKQLFNVFVEPTAFQRQLYHSFLRSSVAQKVLNKTDVKMTATVLGTIRKLQSLVNHPFLVRGPTQRLEAGFDDVVAQRLFEEVDAMDRGFRSHQRPVHEEFSGKLLLLHRLLVSMKESGSGDRVVIISNWTQTLDIIERMCEQNRWPVHRLDGAIAVTRRMKLVNDFNRPENQQAFTFLLSSKAGGCGLNLIGANRLVMFDPDWNPANDRQAMARIWRDGQKKPCYIYRLFTTGTIDEKVYQRQICKDGLSTMMVTETGDLEQTEMRESLAADLIKDLFAFSEDTACATHDMLMCKRCGRGSANIARRRPPATPSSPASGHDFVQQEGEVVEDDLHTWSHHCRTAGVPDPILIDAGLRMQGVNSHVGTVQQQSDRVGISFTMGCHIEFTEEQKARLEEDERSEQRRREAAASPPALAPPAQPSSAVALPPPSQAQGSGSGGSGGSGSSSGFGGSSGSGVSSGSAVAPVAPVALVARVAPVVPGADTSASVAVTSPVAGTPDVAAVAKKTVAFVDDLKLDAIRMGGARSDTAGLRSAVATAPADAKRSDAATPRATAVKVQTACLATTRAPATVASVAPSAAVAVVPSESGLRAGGSRSNAPRACNAFPGTRSGADSVAVRATKASAKADDCASAVPSSDGGIHSGVAVAALAPGDTTRTRVTRSSAIRSSNTSAEAVAGIARRGDTSVSTTHGVGGASNATNLVPRHVHEVEVGPDSDSDSTLIVGTAGPPRKWRRLARNDEDID